MSGKALLYVSETGTGGYAQAAREYLHALRASGRPVTWMPLGWRRGRAVPITGGSADPSLDDLRVPRESYRQVLLHLIPPQHEPWIAQAPLAYTTWETDRLPGAWTAQLNRVQRVIVPSAWNRDTFRRSGVTVPIDVVPHILPADVAALSPSRAERPFTFYCIAPWTHRKAVDLLVRAFCRAFPHGEPVRLVLKTTSRDLTRHSGVFALRHVLDIWHSSHRALRRLASVEPHGAAVELRVGDVARADILALHREGHCFVSLTRGEGWGLGAFEAAGMGNPVVITGLGGPREFLDPQLSHFVEHALTPCRAGRWESWFESDQRWAEPSLDHAAAQMRAVYEHFEDVRERALLQRDRVRARFSAAAVLPSLLRALDASSPGQVSPMPRRGSD